jgi:hypothetical protein
MADDRTNRGEPDRSRVSGSETYEVNFFAEKHGISATKALGHCLSLNPMS